MPTGYTAIFQDRDDVTFREFCLRCARGMGACVMQRDDPMDRPPSMDEKPSDYHEVQLESARERLALYENMTLDQAVAEQSSELAEAQKQAKETAAKKQALQKRYTAMLKRVNAWTPPTEDHRGLKDFMAQQLTESIEWDCDVSYWLNRCGNQLDPQVWLDAKREDAGKDCDYHATKLLEEVQRVTGRNDWKNALVRSL